MTTLDSRPRCRFRIAQTVSASGRALLAVLFAATLGFTGSAAETLKQRPNILLITTDQQQVNAMSAVGNPYLKTPNMDSIATQGVYFTRSYCAFPLCSPSRAALHAGRTPHEIGVDHNAVSIRSAVPISGQIFRAAGYETAYAGKWHLPDAYPSDGIPGFRVLNGSDRKGKPAHDVDQDTMDAAIKFLKQKHEKPFYLVVSFINPHDICLLAGEKSPLRGDVEKKYQPSTESTLPPLPVNFGKNDRTEAGSKHPDWDEKRWQEYRYAYYRMVEDVDRQVGQVLDALRQIGKEDETLIVFTSDHGEGLGAHHWTGKMMFYEEEATVPLIVSWKGVTPGGRIDRTHLVSTLDYLPTICDYAGIKPPPSMRGESLREVIKKPKTEGHQFIVSEISGPRGGRSFMVRTARYKYMFFPEAARSEMFFDLRNDPGEMNDLSGYKSAANELKRHRRILAEWRKSTDEAKYQVTPSRKAERRKGKR